MSSIGTNIAVEAAVRLGTLVDAHARDVGRQLGEWLRPWLRDGETLPDFTLVLQLPARMIRHSGQRLRERQSELDEARSQEADVRLWRDHTASALSRKLVQFRQLLTSVFSAKRTATLLGIEGQTARASQHALLLSQAEAFRSLFRDPQRLAAPDSAYYLDPAAAAADLEPLLVAFREACTHLDEIRQTSAARLEAKDRACADLDGGLQCAASILSGAAGGRRPAARGPGRRRGPARLARAVRAPGARPDRRDPATHRGGHRP